MARVTRVKSAQQRYATKPVLDADGNPKRVPVMRGDKPKTTKSGKVVTMALTERDLTSPKPPLRCDYPNCQHPGKLIQVGTPYMWIKPKSGPYGGRLMARHAEHPAWHVWEYSQSLSARLSQISHDAWKVLDGVESLEDAQAALEDAASAIEDLASEKREGAENIESGFGHPTSQSEELEQMADDLETWAEEVRDAELPDPEDECPDCTGKGQVENPAYDPDTAEEAGEEEHLQCETCEGTGQVDSEETETDWDAWREAVQDAAAIVDESPV